MNILHLILATVRSLAVVVSNPALGGGSSVRVQEVAELLDTLALILEEGEEGRAELQRFADLVKAMAEQGRAPTPAEWQALRDRAAIADETIEEALASAEVEKRREELAAMSGPELMAAAEAVDVVLPENMTREEAEDIVLSAEFRTDGD